MGTDDILNKAVNDVFGYLAKDIVYKADGEFPVTIPFLEAEGEVPDIGGDSVVDTLTIEVQASDVPSPTYRDTFTIDDVVWYYRHPLKGTPGGLTKKLLLTRNERSTFRR